MTTFFWFFQSGLSMARSKGLIPKEGGQVVVVAEDTMGKIGISFLKA